MTISGDTPKDARTASGWPDGTAQNHNLLMVMGGGWLKTGWFGDMDTNGKLTTWDPTTGGAGTQSSAQLASQAAAAAAYAVAKGDARRVQDFGVAAPGWCHQFEDVLIGPIPTNRRVQRSPFRTVQSCTDSWGLGRSPQKRSGELLHERNVPLLASFSSASAGSGRAAATTTAVPGSRRNRRPRPSKAAGSGSPSSNTKCLLPSDPQCDFDQELGTGTATRRAGQLADDGDEHDVRARSHLPPRRGCGRAAGAHRASSRLPHGGRRRDAHADQGRYVDPRREPRRRR